MSIAADLVVLRELLAGLATRIADKPDARGIADVVLPAVADAVGARVATLALRVDQRTLRVVATVGMPVATTGPWEEFDVSAAVPLAASVRDDTPIWLPDAAARRDAFPAMPAELASA